MPILADLAYFPAMLGYHELSHQRAADEAGVPMDWQRGVWLANTQDPSTLSKIAGAGILGQQQLNEILPKARLASGLNKIGYSLFPKGLGGSGLGDVDTLNKANGGGDMMRAALAISGLSDIYRHYNPDTRWSLDFIQGQRGTPGLGFSTRW